MSSSTKQLYAKTIYRCYRCSTCISSGVSVRMSFVSIITHGCAALCQHCEQHDTNIVMTGVTEWTNCLFVYHCSDCVLTADQAILLALRIYKGCVVCKSCCRLEMLTVTIVCLYVDPDLLVRTCWGPIRHCHIVCHDLIHTIDCTLFEWPCECTCQPRFQRSTD